jgi:hypothetical protein
LASAHSGPPLSFPSVARGLFLGQPRNSEAFDLLEFDGAGLQPIPYRRGLGHWECPYEPDYRSGLVVEKEPAVGSSPCTIRGPKLVKFVTRVFIAIPHHPAIRAMLYTLWVRSRQRCNMKTPALHRHLRGLVQGSWAIKLLRLLLEPLENKSKRRAWAAPSYPFCGPSRARWLLPACGS